MIITRHNNDNKFHNIKNSRKNVLPPSYRCHLMSSMSATLPLAWSLPCTSWWTVSLCLLDLPTPSWGSPLFRPVSSTHACTHDTVNRATVDFET